MNTSTSKSDCVLVSNGWNCEVIFRRAYRGTGEPVLAIITGTKESPNQEGIISAIKDRDQVEHFKAIKGIQDQLPHAAKILEIIDNIVITEKVHGKLLWEIEDKVDLPSEESLESELLSIVGELKNSNLVHGDIRPIVHPGPLGINPPDYAVMIFTQDLPDSIQPMAVSTAGPSGAHPHTAVEFATEQFGCMDANNPPFLMNDDGAAAFPVYFIFSRPPFNSQNIWKGGDSGSPNMLVAPDDRLLFIDGRATSGPGSQMQQDMDTLTRSLNLNTNDYQMSWY